MYAFNICGTQLRKYVQRFVLIHIKPVEPTKRVLDAVFLKRTRPRAERADGQPLARLTPGFLPLTAMSVP